MCCDSLSRTKDFTLLSYDYDVVISLISSMFLHDSSVAAIKTDAELGLKRNNV